MKTTETFGIEAGQLDGTDSATAFVLGVEWYMFRERLLEGIPFSESVHTQNVHRLVALCHHHNRFNESRRILELPGWSTIIVGGYQCT